MEFSAGLSQRPDTVGAIDEAIAEATAGVAGLPDLVLVFATRHHLAAADDVARIAHDAVRDGGTSIGAVAEGVIGGDVEVDTGPGIAVMAAVLPDLSLRASHLEAVRTGHGVTITGAERLPEAVGAIMIADPMTFPTVAFVAQLGSEGLPVVGGLADSGDREIGAALFVDGKRHDHGAVVLFMAGPVEFAITVSQGCRPLGEPAIVTEADRTVLRSIAGKPALDFVRDLYVSLDDADRDLARRGLHLGVVMDEYRSEFGRGDFLIRAVVDVDEEDGTVSVGERVPVGRTIQFQVRDPQTAHEDLETLLADQPARGGVLVFTCNGRGRRFFGVPHHDASLVATRLRPPAMAGFFAAGEIGPVGGSNFLHGYTASVVELRPRPGGGQG